MQQAFREILRLLARPVTWAILLAMIALQSGIIFGLQAAMADPENFAAVLVGTLGGSALSVLGFGALSWAMGRVLLADRLGTRANALLRWIGLYVVYLCGVGIIAGGASTAIFAGGYGMQALVLITLVGTVIASLAFFPMLVRLKLLSARIEQPRLGQMYAEMFGKLGPFLLLVLLLALPFALAQGLWMSMEDFDQLSQGMALVDLVPAVIGTIIVFIPELAATAAARVCAMSPASEAEVFA